jgi:uncharacterized linocin/CFP29 family protein
VLKKENQMANNLGREKLDAWLKTPELWDRIDQAVDKEGERTRIARRFIPHVPMADAVTTPADMVTSEIGAATNKLELLKVESGEHIALVEIWVEFALITEQVTAEAALATAVTLATRATNLLAQAEDLLIFQGEEAMSHPIFKTKVGLRGGSPGPGLMRVTDQKVEIEPPTHGRYGEKTFAGVTEAYSKLQRNGHYGPYAAVFHSDIYADTYAPLEKTLIMPADRIKPLMDMGFFGTGTLPKSRGLLFSLGGNTIDLVIGRDAITAYVQPDFGGSHRFRVFERFAVREKDATGRVPLIFKHGK